MEGIQVKKLGYLENGQVLLECSPTEHRAFLMLVDVAAGVIQPEYFSNSRLEGIGKDLEPTFQAIVDWIQAKSHANRLRSLADQIDRELGVNGNV
jgi:hypothetical protein